MTRSGRLHRVVVRRNGAEVGEFGPFAGTPQGEKAAHDTVKELRVRFRGSGNTVEVESIEVGHEPWKPQGWKKPGPTAGGVVINDSGLVLLREPAGHFDGYHWTHAKGQGDSDETPEQTAVREVREETGYDAEIVMSLGKVANVIYFLMRPVAQAGQPHWETASVAWVSPDEAVARIKQSTNYKAGRDYDVLVDAVQAWRKARGLPAWAPPAGPAPPPPPKGYHHGHGLGFESLGGGKASSKKHKGYPGFSHAAAADPDLPDDFFAGWDPWGTAPAAPRLRTAEEADAFGDDLDLPLPVGQLPRRRL